MTYKHLEIKKRHHYVWAAYLARWGRGTRNVFYTTKNGKFAHDSVRAIVVDDFFYKTTTLNGWHIEVIKSISRKSPNHLQERHMSLLRDFLKMQAVQVFYDKSGTKNHEVESQLHAMQCNVLENLHSAYERSVMPILSALADENLDVLHNKQYMVAFMAFIGQQFSRTKAFRDGAFQVLSRSTAMEIKVADAITHAWWFLSHIYGINIGLSLFLERHNSRHALLINDSKVPFITSDQPIVNVHECVSETEFVAPKYADFYYPISPRIAYIICESERFKSGKNNVDETTVVELNSKLAAQAMIHIIGDTEDAIRPFKKYIGRNRLTAPDNRGG
jgi:hypothetical protein